MTRPSTAPSPVRWVTAFIDRPAASFDLAATFWTAVTDTTLSPRRGERGEFATLLPDSGDACVRLQGVGDAGGAHLDLEVEDLDAMVEHATAVGATVEETSHDGLVVIRTPAGLLACLTTWQGASTWPPPAQHANGAASQVDQVCLDIPPSRHDAECAFWAALTGWRHWTRESGEFSRVLPPREAKTPINILLQRTDDEQPATAHLDVSTSDVAAVRQVHEAHGAELVHSGRHWEVMRDPAGGVYCLADRKPGPLQY